MIQPGSSPPELVEVVGLDGTVLQIVSRSEMRARRLRHRCTYVVVTDFEERLLVHRRADWKDVWPSRWDIAFGGVAAVGEAWHAAAERELAEEAGITAVLHEVGAASYDDDTVSILGRIFRASSTGPFTFPDGEVVDSRWIHLSELEGWLETVETCPDSVELVRAVVARGGLDGPPADGTADDVRRPPGEDR